MDQQDNNLSAAVAGFPEEGLLQALERLDGLLSKAVAAAEFAYGPQAAADPYRGLYISLQQAEQLLSREPGVPLLYAVPETRQIPEGCRLASKSRLSWLAEVYGLDAFDLDVIILALAPELDRRYERLYAYLQDDVTRKSVCVDLVLHLLCPTAMDRLARRSHFAPDAPLIGEGIIRLLPDSLQAQPSLLSHILKLDEQILNFLLHQDSLDSRLAAFCKVLPPDFSMPGLPLPISDHQDLTAFVLQARETAQPLCLYFQGWPGTGKRQTAAALARELEVQLLAVDLSGALAAPLDFLLVLKLISRQAWFLDAILYVEGWEELLQEDRLGHYRQLHQALVKVGGISILAGTQPWAPAGGEALGVMTVTFPVPEVPERSQYWQECLANLGFQIDSMEIDHLAGRFRLTPVQIADAAILARNLAAWRAQAANAGLEVDLTMADLFTAARIQTGHKLGRLAKKIEPRYTWDDIILPDDTMAQLRELCQRVDHHHQVLGQWGFDRKLSLGKGVNALFAGPSGTGKTMAAEIVARQLGLDLYKIDLSGVVSKYIGETEKNLDRIFTAAEDANAILFFDEADALFGKRSEVRDSHDRYANIEVSYLLQKIEEYDGLAILATNLRQHLDESFVRRLAFTVPFPFPDESSRRLIWTRVWPPETPLAEGVDFRFLASQFNLSGGNIKNIALAAAFLAAADGRLVTRHHLLQATRREYQKMGKMLSEADLGYCTPEATT